jgi:glycosyltransferase involved in cell wall biosynthesis
LTVDILMATYNGQNYLRNQLLSLQQQTHGDWVLWIRDDGSTDGTLAIIETFAQADSRIRYVVEESGAGLGPGRNFLGLAKYATSDFAIFCDQDDIWFEKKLEILLDFGRKHFDVLLPCCVYCDAHGYSDRDGVISIPSVSHLHATRLEEFLFFNGGYQGCSLLFNSALTEVIKTYKASYFYMHDDVVSLVGHVFGKVYFVPKCLMLYRQHDLNVTGNVTNGLLDKLSRLLSTDSYVLSRNHYEEKKSFFAAYHAEMGNEAKKLFTAYLRFPEGGLARRLWLVVRHGFSMGGHTLPLIIKTLLRRPLE